jgi:phage terminase large subunit-like protein
MTKQLQTQSKVIPNEQCNFVLLDIPEEVRCILSSDIIIETNQGGNLVVQNLKLNGRQAPIVEVRARRGKLLRAEPIAGLYERNLVRHFGTLTKAESQMCNFNQHHNKKELCDIVDSTVYALQALLDRTERYYSNGSYYAVGGPRETVMTFKVM